MCGSQIADPAPEAANTSVKNLFEDNYLQKVLEVTGCKIPCGFL